MVKSPVFWLMYLMFVLMGAGGLMATAQLALIAKDFLVADVPVSLVGLTMPALTFALALDRVLNGITRPFFGWVSDHIGRENTMFIAFGLEGIGILALAAFGTDPVSFVILSGLVFFAWGEIYSLFPATVTDTYGARYATTNTGLMYTAKGTASLLVPLGNVLMTATGHLARRIRHRRFDEHPRCGARALCPEADARHLHEEGGGGRPGPGDAAQSGVDLKRRPRAAVTQKPRHRIAGASAATIWPEELSLRRRRYPRPGQPPSLRKPALGS